MMSLKNHFAQLMLGCLLVCHQGAQGASAPELDPSGGRVEDRQQLRKLLDQMESAISNLELERILKLTTSDVVVTWQNGEVSRGQDQIRAYYARMMQGGAPVVKKFSTKATLGGPATFHADSAIAYGTTIDRYELNEGLDFTLNARWSTTIVKVDGQWKVAALHFSTNLFDNALLNAAKRSVWYAAGGAFLSGVLLTWLLFRLRRRST